MSADIESKSGQDELPTKQKILTCAVNLFAAKGFTETTVRELADAAGLRGASIYNHFPSKNAILEYLLNDYSMYNSGSFDKDEARAKLRKNSSVDGIMDCLTLYFPEDKTEYYLKVLYVLLQEQHRNPLVQDFVSNHIILQAEHKIRDIYQILKELNVIRQDMDIDPWAKIQSSLLYAFSSRMLLGIGDGSPSFTGMGMRDLLKYMIEQVLSTFAVS